jgi:Xaa-Pro aminopeptidase
MSEFGRKQERIQAFLDEQMLDALLLQRVSSFAWATCGAASYVNTATSTGEAMLLITRSGWHLLTNNIEATRLEQEERLAQQGWEFHVRPWHEARDMVEEAVQEVQPGQTEYQIAALLAQQAESRGVQAIVNLIATDKRIFHFRHPLPTEKELESYGMLVLCGRRWGLICSLTRLVHFGRLPDELRRKAETLAQVDAAFVAATRPGQTLGQVFDQAVLAYKATGFADEWRLHHQGGPAGYEPREYIATPASTDLVVVGQAYAWNPSITGVKSEDTILVGDEESEVMTAIDGWPMLPVMVSGKEYARPGVLEVL